MALQRNIELLKHSQSFIFVAQDFIRHDFYLETQNLTEKRYCAL